VKATLAKRSALSRAEKMSQLLLPRGVEGEQGKARKMKKGRENLG